MCNHHAEFKQRKQPVTVESMHELFDRYSKSRDKVLIMYIRYIRRAPDIINTSEATGLVVLEYNLKGQVVSTSYFAT
jgi:alpha-N-acetylglucosamine transferase